MPVRLIYDRNFRLGINVVAPTLATVELVPSWTSDVGLKITAKAGQTANLQEWVGETPATETAQVDKDGIFGFASAQFGVPVSVTLAANAAGSGGLLARSNHQHQLSVAIVPTWTGAHVFAQTAAGTANITVTGVANQTTSPVIVNQGTGAGPSGWGAALAINQAVSPGPTGFGLSIIGGTTLPNALATALYIAGGIGANKPNMQEWWMGHATPALRILRSYVDNAGYIYGWDGTAPVRLDTPSFTSSFLLMGA